MLTLTQYDPSNLTKLGQVNTLPLVSRAALKTAYVTFVWSERSRTRAALKHLPTARLKDLGLTEAEAQQECKKWFWRP